MPTAAGALILAVAAWAALAASARPATSTRATAAPDARIETALLLSHRGGIDRHAADDAALARDRGPGAITLEISGSPDVDFAGNCTVTSANGEEVVAVAGTIPFSRAFRASGLRCHIVKRAPTGMLSVEIRKGTAVVGRSTTTAAGGSISIAVR